MSIPTITQTFDPSIGEYGQDYALPVGRPIYSPVAGTIGTEDKGKSDWGKRVFVHLSKATADATGVATFAVGHLTKFAVSAGQHINAGDLIGYSGGATSDPSSGNTNGPHVEPQFFGKDFNPINPVDVFKRFTSWEEAIFNKPSSGWNWLTGVAPGPDFANTGLPNPLAGIPEAITAATSQVQSVATRAFWFGFALVLFIIGLFLIVSGDLEKLGDKVGDVAEKIAPAAVAA